MQLRAYRAFEDFCLHAPGTKESLPECFRLLRAAVDSEHAAFFEADEGGRLCGAFHEIAEHGRMAERFIERARDVTDGASDELPTVEELFQQATPIQTLRFDDRGSRETPMFREVIGPIGGRQVLRVAVRSRTRPLGLIALVRGRSRGGFHDHEASDLLQLARPFARLLGAPRAERRLDSEGFLFVSPRGELLSADANGQRLYATLDDQRCVPRRDPEATLRALSRASASEEFECTFGLLRLEPIALQDVAVGTPRPLEAPLLVRIQRWLSPRLDALGAMENFGLSSMQKHIALDLLRGLTQGEMASEHGVAVATVITHVRAIYTKTGAASREELQDLLEKRRARN